MIPARLSRIAGTAWPDWGAVSLVSRLLVGVVGIAATVLHWRYADQSYLGHIALAFEDAVTSAQVNRISNFDAARPRRQRQRERPVRRHRRPEDDLACALGGAQAAVRRNTDRAMQENASCARRHCLSVVWFTVSVPPEALKSAFPALTSYPDGRA